MPRTNWKSKYLQQAAINEANLARIQALGHDLVHREADIVELRAEIDRLSAQLRRLHIADRVIRDRTGLMLFAKQQAQLGVPCYVQGTQVLHSKTKEVLAEMQS